MPESVEKQSDPLDKVAEPMTRWDLNSELIELGFDEISAQKLLNEKHNRKEQHA